VEVRAGSAAEAGRLAERRAGRGEAVRVEEVIGGWGGDRGAGGGDADGSFAGRVASLAAQACVGGVFCVGVTAFVWVVLGAMVGAVPGWAAGAGLVFGVAGVAACFRAAEWAEGLDAAGDGSAEPIAESAMGA
jgi:hypothetical protein